MKEKTCCFTGHRKIPPDEYESIKERLRKELILLIESGVIYFGAGGALGFDTMAALMVLELKKVYEQIRLIMVLPCKEQDKFWNEENKKIYKHILNNADKIVYTSEKYYDGCMQKRNRRLVEGSGVCVCYLTEVFGGTAYTVKLVKSQGLRIVNIG